MSKRIEMLRFYEYETNVQTHFKILSETAINSNSRVQKGAPPTVLSTKFAPRTRLFWTIFRAFPVKLVQFSKAPLFSTIIQKKKKM